MWALGGLRVGSRAEIRPAGVRNFDMLLRQASSVRLRFFENQMQIRFSITQKAISDVGLSIPNEGHGGSVSSVVCLKGARLERCPEC
jgi:hypothetical protein